MITNRNTLFRPEALERNASPERLDQLVQIVNPRRWLSLVALGSLVSAGVAWSVMGQIPITVKGQGILTYPSQVSPLQTASTGEILELKVNPGDSVAAGEVIAVLDQQALEQQLSLAQNKLQQLRDQEQLATALQTQRRQSEQLAIEQERRRLQQTLQSEQSLTPILRTQAQSSLQQERAALQSRRGTLVSQASTYQDRANRFRAANAAEVKEERGSVFSDDEILQVEQVAREAQNEIKQIDAQLSQLTLENTNAQREYAQNLNRIADLQTQLRELETRSRTQTEQDALAALNRQKEIQETERTIAQLTVELADNKTIVSPVSGKIVELRLQAGQQLQAGMEVGSIATYDDSQPPMSISFLPVEEGMKVEPEMEIKVTPTTVKREEYGGILGQVEERSAYPVTQEEAARLVGNFDILPGIMTEGPHVAIYSQLENNPDQRCRTPEAGESEMALLPAYKWSSSQGPDNQCFAPGTTAQVQITVEKKRPILYVLPALKQWLGVG